MPKNDSVSFAPATLGAKNVPNELFAASKNSSELVFAASTSVNIAPNSVVNAGVVDPGMKNDTPTMLLPREVKSRAA